MTLDDLRDRFPLIGFAVYAFEPRGAVTIEMHLPDGTYPRVQAWTVAEAIALVIATLDPSPVVAKAEDIFD